MKKSKKETVLEMIAAKKAAMEREKRMLDLSVEPGGMVVSTYQADFRDKGLNNLKKFLKDG